MNWNQFKRESDNRTASERIIDRFLFKSEKENTNKKNELLYSNEPKKVKIENKEERKINVGSENLKKDPQEVLLKLLQFLENPNKFEKSLGMIYKLLESEMNSFYPLHILQIVFIIHKNYNNIKKTRTNSEILNDIFVLIEMNHYLDELLKEEEINKVYVLLKAKAEYSYMLLTDDNYQFNATMKKITKLFEEIGQDYLKQEDDYEDENDSFANNIDLKLGKNEKLEINYQYQLDANLLALLNKKAQVYDFKRNVVFLLLKESFQLFNQEWAKPSIKSLITQIFHKKELFEPEQIEEISRLMNLTIQSKNKDHYKLLKTDNLEKDILTNPLNSKNDVVDARSITFSGDGVNSWACKQLGL